MNSIKKPMTILEDRQVPIQAKLAAFRVDSGHNPAPPWARRAQHDVPR